MKRLILFELLLLFLATTFKSDSTGGWVQQILPRNNVIVDDIFFTDSSNGWSTAHITPGFDTAFIFSTTNGGANWLVQYQLPIAVFNAIQFLNNDTGYAAGGTGPGQLYKTTNAGVNWINISTSMVGLGTLEDMFFVNNNTGWVCDANTFGGLAKTTNSGINWQLELNDASAPSKLFFLNKDTGWVICQTTKLLRTTDSGLNWIQIFNSFNSLAKEDLFFANKDTGWVLCQNPNTIYKTINGGFNWQQQVDPEPTGSGVSKIQMINPKLGYISAGFITHILKTTDGVNWFSQNAPGAYTSISFTDSLTGWAGSVGFVSHTTDGGGPPVGIQQIGNEIPKDYVLFQNYPNPFNPLTKIKYQITSNVKRETSDVKLIIYDITGREITTLVNQKQNPGTYQVDFDGTNLPSGVYFYNLIVDGILIDTKKMVLLK